MQTSHTHMHLHKCTHGLEQTLHAEHAIPPILHSFKAPQGPAAEALRQPFTSLDPVFEFERPAAEGNTRYETTKFELCLQLQCFSSEATALKLGRRGDEASTVASECKRQSLVNMGGLVSSHRKRHMQAASTAPSQIEHDKQCLVEIFCHSPVSPEFSSSPEPTCQHFETLGAISGASSYQLAPSIAVLPQNKAPQRPQRMAGHSRKKPARSLIQPIRVNQLQPITPVFPCGLGNHRSPARAGSRRLRGQKALFSSSGRCIGTSRSPLKEVPDWNLENISPVQHCLPHSPARNATRAEGGGASFLKRELAFGMGGGKQLPPLKDLSLPTSFARSPGMQTVCNYVGKSRETVNVCCPTSPSLIRVGELSECLECIDLDNTPLPITPFNRGQG